MRTMPRAAIGAVLVVALAGPVPAAAADHADRRDVQRALDRIVEADGLPGAQAVLTWRGRSWEITSGVGDLRTGRPFPPESRVRIGSNTKPFVATVVLQLVAERRVDLDAPIERYLPGVVRGNGNDGSRISVRQLLQHTSGLHDYVAVLHPDPEAWRWRHFEPAELVRLALAHPPHFEPGAKWEYSNTNYQLAGMLIEKLTGNPVGAEITRRVIRPLGLRATYYPHPRELGIRGPHPRGYAEIDGRRVDFTLMDPSWAGAAGAMVASGAELNRFFTALLAGRLLPAAQLAEMKRTVPADVPIAGARYGLGLIDIPLSCGGRFWGHGGSIDGFRTRGGVTADGRAVNVAVNQLPTTEQGDTDVMRAVDTALCPQ
ncbi:serine hydrolase domain-containing protein [Amycolatopsis anabasis]|uniref:serine hydrolase domain-containing protein n=1 Tax=Amycolatopsis anabasis TaxID=1840409 RepID=UPI00131BE525|nr:serine hydrolase domain-containing protein [Amycolatopsis anabasis]